MGEKIPIDKDFLMRVLNQVDALTKRVAELERIIALERSSMTLEDFSKMYNVMVEKNLNAYGLGNFIQPPQ